MVFSNDLRCVPQCQAALRVVAHKLVPTPVRHDLIGQRGELFLNVVAVEAPGVDLERMIDRRH
jgi:hypothetical protein